MAETGKDTTPPTADGGFLARLTRTRFAVRGAIMLERLWPLVLPLVVAASLFLSLSWLGVFRVVPDWARLLLTAVFALGALAALYPLRLYRQPTPSEIDRRIERANRLEHAPVLAQTDRLSSTSQDAFAQALWREHQKRMAARLGRLSGDLPRTRVPERDPWGLRAAAALLLVVAFAFSFGPLGGSPADAFRNHARAETVPARIDAWVTPPAYTGRAPLFLSAHANDDPAPVFRVPAGSAVAVRVTGGAGDETLSWLDAHSGEEADIEVAEGATPRTDGATARQFAATLSQDGLLALESAGAELQRWAFNVVPDNPPAIRFADEPKRAANGALELAYEVEDDYGPSSARAVFEQAAAAAPNARPLYEAPEMPLTLPRRNGRDIAARTSRDLSEHPWAGSEVELTLEATDAAEQQARSETKTIVLPQRPFANPVARALVEQRRILALDANRKGRVLDLIDAITLRPEDTFDNMAHYLGIMAARTRLRMAQTDDALRDVADYLWEIALTIEDGALTDAERRLRQAQEALKEALENGASDEEIEQLMAELRDAMQDFLREFAERAQQNPDMAMQMPMDGQELRQSDLDRMMDQIENLARSGARDQAMEMLQQLQEMMNNLQAGNQQQGQQGQGAQSEMRQQMDELGELMRRQQEMMNETFRLDQMQRGDGQQQQGQQGQGQQPMTPEEFAEAMRQLQEGQGQLQQDLQALTEALEGMGMEPGEGFGDAGEAMGRAEGSLGEGQGERAVGEQGQALEALRRGAQDMMQQMMQAMRQEGDQGSGQEGGRQQSSDRDPLGRPRATTGPDFGNSVEVPDEIDVQRARQILEEIRRRLGNALSPELERNYLERLLDLR
ncbi:TIGR02302 family protein [Mesorhizobium microcysteis]|uniref:TIGR02302 family protein n=1 Tax=Neoaquamicrobium microcysteis TaxID=2682781 RepID=A0A5D4H2T1_9HYPH|nr:TIGR02302 family protein [Mesorhizobium microcysteis]TYR34958.1 TIGR02302 family protein [Mesorhizobium microcysteis]